MTEASADTGPEPQRHTGHLIRRAQQRHAALWQEQVSSEISSVQYAVLAVLERCPRASQSALGSELGLDRSTVADLVTRLQRRGLLERHADEHDRRRYALCLTDTGERELQRLRPLVTSVNATLTEPLTVEELATLRALLQRIVRAGGQHRNAASLPATTTGSSQTARQP